MKLKKLYVAMAISTLAAPMAGMADDNITSRLAAGKLSGEAFGGYWNTKVDFDAGSSSESDSSDFTFDRVRLGYEAGVKDDVIFGAELELFPGSESDDVLSGSRFTDLYLQKNKPNMSKTLGRFKQTFNRESATELSDNLFTQMAGFTDTDFDSALGITDPSLADLYRGLLNGADRRIEGGEIKGTQPTGLNYTFAVYKGGIDSTDGDSDRSFGYAGSVGWQGGDDDIQFGFNAGLFQQQGDESDVGSNVENVETMGYRLGGNLTSGIFSGNLYYASNEAEFDFNGSSASDLENTTFGAHASFDLGGARRSFDEFNVRQGPSLSGDDWAYEAVLMYRQDSIEQDGSSGDIDFTQWGIGVNAYCSEYTKLYGSYSSLEIDGGGSQKPTVDQFALGVRFDF